MTRIPYDSFTLSAVVAELQAYVGGKVQEIRQPSETEVAIGLYARGQEAMFLLSCDPVFARAHFITKRPKTIAPPPAFCATLRARLDGAWLVRVRQIQGDRVLELSFSVPQVRVEAADDVSANKKLRGVSRPNPSLRRQENVVEGTADPNKVDFVTPNVPEEGPRSAGSGVYRLIAEIMGKHSNLILVEPGGRVLSAAHWVSEAKSRRPIQSGRPYAWPPVLSVGEELKPSPFYRSLAAARGRELAVDGPVLSPGHGAYPTSVAKLGYPELPRASISIALEHFYDQAIPEFAATALRTSLVTQLDRVILAREAALSDLRQALAVGGRAAGWQRYGELLLAYGPSSPEGASLVAVWDYDGTERRIPVDPERNFKENAQAYFERAKKAKGSLSAVADQIQRLSADLDSAETLRARVSAAERLDALRELQEEARGRRWLTTQAPLAKAREDRPYAGHRIRELAAPGGWTLLFGENAEANDYLTLRVARPNDWWLHVRGGTSAHVVLVTRNQPDRVQRETLEYAARVAVLNSSSKHAGYVPVDYTLKKYVRKPRGAAKGAAQYSNEKTIHVDSKG